MDVFKRAILIGGAATWVFLVLLSSRTHVGNPTSGAVSARIAAGIIAVTAAVAVLDRKFPGHAPDPLLDSAWSIGRGMTLSLLILLTAALFTGGVASTLPEVVIGMLLSGVAAGSLHARWVRRRPPVVHEARALESGMSHSTGSLRIRAAEASLRFFWFVIGCFGALLLMVPVATIANQLRGPTEGITELGTWDYVQDQHPVNRAVGLAVAGLALATGVVLRARQAPAPLVAGVIITASVLAVAFAMLPQ